MKIPLDGPWPFQWVAIAMVWAACLVSFAIRCSTLSGPALAFASFDEVSQLPDRCRGALLATVLWMLLYKNFRGIEANNTVLFVMEILKPSDVTQPQFGAIASRIANNTLEQAPIFIPMLWLYTLFVDYGSAGPLGLLYVLCRLLYAPSYLIPCEFSAATQFATQPGYGVNGILILGVLVQATGGNWIAWLESSPVGAPVLGYLLGTMAMLPGLPLAPFFTALYYVSHKRWEKRCKTAKKD